MSVRSLSVEEQEELYESYLKDVEVFAGDYFGHMMEHDTPDFHREIYQMLREESRVALAAPRGFAKSTLVCVIYPIWLSVMQIMKDILIISASETLAVEFLRKVRLFGDMKDNSVNVQVNNNLLDVSEVRERLRSKGKIK